MISRATSSDASSAQRSAVLNATTRTGLPAGYQIGNDGFQIGPFGICLAIGPAQPTEVFKDDVDGLIGAVRHNRRGPASTHTQLPTQLAAGESKHETGSRSCTEINFRPNLAKAGGDLAVFGYPRRV
jgi:hypothetical protein